MIKDHFIVEGEQVKARTLTEAVTKYLDRYELPALKLVGTKIKVQEPNGGTVMVTLTE
jgi:Flp pilus assembly protein TadB